MKRIKVTLRRVFEAMKEDGTPKIQGSLIKYDDPGDIKPSCAIGGAAQVLGVDEWDLEGALEELSERKSKPISPWNFITRRNDDTETSKAAIGEAGLKKYANHLDTELEVSRKEG